MITIPDLLWEQMLDAFHQTPRGLERVAYFDGIRYPGSDNSDHGVVTTLVVPRATLSPRNYEISAEAMAEAGGHLHTNGLSRLLQVHTHGNDWVDHSRTDDALAFTRRPGAISIVLPYHAHHRPRPLEGGVHVRRRDGWRRVRDDDAATLIRLVPGLRDLRPSTQPKQSFWRRLPWNR